MEPGGRDWLEDRIRGCLGFAALGDAAGAPFEGCTREEVRSQGDPLVHVWSVAAEVTDDTGQLEALARALVESGGELTDEVWRPALLEWFETSPTAGKAGPTTRAILEGDPHPPDERIGVTNGSAMRVAPCGLVHPGDPEAAVELAWAAGRITHDTQVAAAAAGAVAAGVAVALRPGAGIAEVTEGCVLGAALGNGLGVRHGRVVALPRVSTRIELAIREARAARDMNEVLERIEATVGTSMLAFESVPAAIGLLAAGDGQPMDVLRAAVWLGGDTDTIASMAGALAGALHGYAALEPDDRAVVDLVLPGLDELVPGLAAIAAGASPPETPR